MDANSFSLDFLRISRGSIDDSITQNLNALVTPASAGFDPSVTSTRSYRGDLKIPTPACETFKSKVLFRSWKARTDVLQYCASVAMSPDPDDPDLVARQLENEKDKQRVIDDRLDPYSSRFFPRESRTEQLASVIRMEQGVEKIVRARTWDVVEQRCGDSTGKGEQWEKAFKEWETAEKNKETSHVSLGPGSLLPPSIRI